MLRDDALEFLIISLPAILIADSNTNTTESTTTPTAAADYGKAEIPGEALEALLRVFSRVSFDSKFVNTRTLA
jgi:hypothetical protein